MYFNKKSYYSPTFFKELAKAITKGVAGISSNKNGFCKSISIYTKALAKSGIKQRYHV